MTTIQLTTAELVELLEYAHSEGVSTGYNREYKGTHAVQGGDYAPLVEHAAARVTGTAGAPELPAVLCGDRSLMQLHARLMELLSASRAPGAGAAQVCAVRDHPRTVHLHALELIADSSPSCLDPGRDGREWSCEADYDSPSPALVRWCSVHVARWALGWPHDGRRAPRAAATPTPPSDAPRDASVLRACPDCGGSGAGPSEPFDMDSICPTCSGSGYAP